MSWIPGSTSVSWPMDQNKAFSICFPKHEYCKAFIMLPTMMIMLTLWNCKQAPNLILSCIRIALVKSEQVSDSNARNTSCFLDSFPKEPIRHLHPAISSAVLDPAPNPGDFSCSGKVHSSQKNRCGQLQSEEQVQVTSVRKTNAVPKFHEDPFHSHALLPHCLHNAGHCTKHWHISGVQVQATLVRRTGK